MSKISNKTRADGYIAVQVYLGMVDGKRKYKTVYGKTQKEADEKAKKVKDSLQKGIDILSTDCFNIWADNWIESKARELNPTRIKTLTCFVNVWKSLLQGINMSRVKPYQLQEAFTCLCQNNPNTNKPMSYKTAKAYKQCLNSIFNFAYDNRIIEYDPSTKIQIPQGLKERHRRALTSAERTAIIEFKHRAQPSAMLIMFSGLRRGEATALQWDDIDFENNTILVTKSYKFSEKKIKAPKNNKSRIVTVSPFLTDYLKSLPRISPYVLTNANGGMMTESSWKRLYESYIIDLNIEYGYSEDNKPNKYNPYGTKMKIQPFTPHELRHTFCTMMYEAGVDVVTAKEQMGHADIKTTLDIYTHLSAEKKRKGLDKMDNYISEQFNNNKNKA